MMPTKSRVFNFPGHFFHLLMKIFYPRFSGLNIKLVLLIFCARKYNLIILVVKVANQCLGRCTDIAS